MKLLKLVRKDDANDIERTSLFHTKGLCTISERAQARSIIDHLEALDPSEQIRFLASLENRRAVFSAFSKLTR